MKQIIKLLLFAIILSIAFSCGSKSNSPQKLKVALIMKAASNPFFARMETGARQAADSLGINLMVGSTTRETDIEQQISIVENMIVQSVQAILIAPSDSKAIVNVLKKAQRQNIFIINIDNRIDAETARAAELDIECYIGVDNALGGQMAGEYLVGLLDGKGNVAMLEGIRGVDNAEARKSGFLKSIKNTEIKLVASQSANWAQDEGLDVFANMLQAFPNINGLFCANDMMALGAMQAIEQAGKTGQIFVASYDNLKAAQQAILANKLHGTIEQHPEIMGFEGIVAAHNLIEGKSIPQEKLVQLGLITKEALK
jgi:ribose transport system substrate-binding protein